MLQTIDTQKTNNLSDILDSKAKSLNALQKKQDSIDLAIADLKLQKAQLNKKQDQTQAELTNLLDSLGISKYETASYRFQPRNYMPKVEIEDKDLIPVKYQKERVTKSIDRIKMRQDMQNGVEISGAVLKPVRSTKITVVKKQKSVSGH